MAKAPIQKLRAERLQAAKRMRMESNTPGSIDRPQVQGDKSVVKRTPPITATPPKKGK